MSRWHHGGLARPMTDLEACREAFAEMLAAKAAMRGKSGAELRPKREAFTKLVKELHSYPRTVLDTVEREHAERNAPSALERAQRYVAAHPWHPGPAARLLVWAASQG